MWAVDEISDIPAYLYIHIPEMTMIVIMRAFYTMHRLLHFGDLSRCIVCIIPPRIDHKYIVSMYVHCINGLHVMRGCTGCSGGEFA